MQKQHYTYDAFISHAVEDKIAIANELCERLENKGLKIWYSGKELNAGDSIKHTIEEGLQQSRFGIIIFSKNYMAKNWPWRELFTLMSREEQGHKVILPVWYEITPEELALEHLEFGDRFGLNISRGIDYVVDKLVLVIQQEKQAASQEQDRNLRDRRKKKTGIVLGTLVFLLALLGGFLGFKKVYHPVPDDVVLHAAIQRHLDDFQEKVNLKHQSALSVERGTNVSVTVLDELYAHYKSIDSHYRNEYTLYTDNKVVKSKKRVEAALACDLDTMVPGNNYKLEQASLFRFDDNVDNNMRSNHYAVVNTKPIEFEIVQVDAGRTGEFHVVVNFTNTIRYISVWLKSPGKDDIKRYDVTLYALLPKDEFIVNRVDGEWTLRNTLEPGSE